MTLLGWTFGKIYRFVVDFCKNLTVHCPNVHLPVFSARFRENCDSVSGEAVSEKHTSVLELPLRSKSRSTHVVSCQFYDNWAMSAVLSRSADAVRPFDVALLDLDAKLFADDVNENVISALVFLLLNSVKEDSVSSSVLF